MDRPTRGAGRAYVLLAFRVKVRSAGDESPFADVETGRFGRLQRYVLDLKLHKGSIPTARCRSCKFRGTKKPQFPRLLQSPLTDSSRRPPPYHGLFPAIGRKRRQRFWLVLAAFAPMPFAGCCHRLPRRGSHKGSVLCCPYWLRWDGEGSFPGRELLPCESRSARLASRGEQATSDDAQRRRDKTVDNRRRRNREARSRSSRQAAPRNPLRPVTTPPIHAYGANIGTIRRRSYGHARGLTLDHFARRSYAGSCAGSACSRARSPSRGTSRCRRSRGTRSFARRARGRSRDRRPCTSIAAFPPRRRSRGRHVARLDERAVVTVDVVAHGLLDEAVRDPSRVEAVLEPSTSLVVHARDLRARAGRVNKSCTA